MSAAGETGRGGALAGVVVAVTRPALQSDGLRAAVEGLGGVARMFPLIETRACNLGRLRTALARAPELLVFTSSAGVDAYAQAGLRVQAPAACVGPRTADAAAGAGLVAFAPPCGYAAEGLLSHLSTRPELVRERRVLVVQGELAAPVLRDGLRRLGAKVEDIVAYRTVRTPHAGALVGAVETGVVDALTFASGSAVSAFAAVWRQRVGDHTVWPASVAVAVLGPRTRSAARRVGIPVHAIADEAAVQELAAALAAYYDGKREGE